MSAAPLGVFDSGVGGLTVFQALERALPQRSMVYLGDTARVPYGTRSPDTVRRYAVEAAHFLGRYGIELLVVACNTASAVALDAVAGAVDVPVLGVIVPGARCAVEASARGRIGVIGTRATIASGAYTAAIHAVRSDVEVLAEPCPLFVPLAEEGWTDDEVAHQVASRYLAPLRAADVDTLVLGCTHYPLLRGVIGRVMGDGVRLVDSAEAVALEVRKQLGDVVAQGPLGGDRTVHRFFVTDAPGPFQSVAERFLGRPVEQLERAIIAGD